MIVKNYYIIDGTVYDFGDDGVKRDTVVNKIIVTVNNNKYYVINNTVVINIYVFVDSHIYYFGTNGIMLVNSSHGGYSFNSAGMLTGNGIYIEIESVIYEINGTVASIHIHSYTSKTVTPTCQSGGYTEYTCICGHSYKDNITGTSSHNYVDGICVTCGDKLYSPGLNFVLSYVNHESYYIVEVINCKDTEMIIPATYNGIPVREIANPSMYGSNNITKSIIIPYGIRKIRDYAFNSFTELTSITIPESVTDIGEMAFAFCKNLTEITIPDSVTSLGNGAFYYCQKLSKAEIGKGITALNNGLFDSCIALESVMLSGKITDIGAFAFIGCHNLTKFTIPEVTTSIGESAFANCSKLSDLTISDTVTSIGSDAFANCYALRQIKFTGNQSQWESITKEKDWDRNMNSYQIIYNS